MAATHKPPLMKNVKHDVLSAAVNKYANYKYFQRIPTFNVRRFSEKNIIKI